MTLSLKKGGNLSLSKEAPAMTVAHIGLGWDVRRTDGVDYDLDASLFLLDAQGKIIGEDGFIFYNQKESTCGSIVHQGDNRTGDGDGDDEVVKVVLAKVPEAIQKIVVAVTIHEAEKHGLNFGQIENAFVRVVDDANQNEVARYDLSEDASTETAMLFAELYRHNGEWKFRAVGQGYAGGLGAMARSYGLDIK